MSIDEEAAGFWIPLTKGMENETEVVTDGVVAGGAVTEVVAVSNRELSSEEVTDNEGSLIEDKSEDDVGVLIEEGT